MTSPFPGMDPFLEHPSVFPDFHDRFVSYISEVLQPDLPKPYYAALGRRSWVEISERFIGPDVKTKRGQESFSDESSPIIPRSFPKKTPDPFSSDATKGGVAIAEHSATGPLVVHVPHDERSETLIEIFVGRQSERRLVTAIEVLSPTNKNPGELGRTLYLRKQEELRQSKTHLVEIDLLRGGTHVTAVPRDRLEQTAAPFDYHVCLHRFDNLEDYFIYPIRLPQLLPTIHVPLLPGDGEVPLDLQKVFNRTYDAGPYPREIDYHADPIVPPLSTEYAKWCGKLLEGRGRTV